jgi:hypothetical protein
MTSTLLSNYCFNWRPEDIPTQTIFTKKFDQIYLVMPQTFDLYSNVYESWKTTFNRLEHSLKINRSNSFSNSSCLVPTETEFLQSPKKIYIFEFLGHTSVQYLKLYFLRLKAFSVNKFSIIRSVHSKDWTILRKSYKVCVNREWEKFKMAARHTILQ